MSTTLEHPAHAPVYLRPASDERWEAALARAQSAGVKAFKVSDGLYAVTSATDPTIAYMCDGTTCTCPAALFGDECCLHRALVRQLQAPQPEPPAHQAYDPVAQQLRWAENDLARAHRDLERYSIRLERGDVLTEREFLAFELAQQRELDAHDRIVALKAEQNVSAAA